MNFVYSKHSIEQIKLPQLDQIIKHDVNSSFFQKLVIEGNKQYLYRVLVNTQKQLQMVITVYKTSKIEKYENQV